MARSVGVVMVFDCQCIKLALASYFQLCGVRMYRIHIYIYIYTVHCIMQSPLSYVLLLVQEAGYRGKSLFIVEEEEEEESVSKMDDEVCNYTYCMLHCTGMCNRAHHGACTLLYLLGGKCRCFF